MPAVAGEWSVVMATFVLTPGVDNFTGNPGETNFFEFTTGNLQATDTVTGGATGAFLDVLRLTSAGTISAAQFAGVTNVEELDLPNGANVVSLTAAMVAGSSLANGFFNVAGGTDGDNIDASAVNNGKHLNIAGGASADLLRGGTGNDNIDGGTGDDQMFGGAGNDIYVIDSTSDVVAENLNEGNDVVHTTVDYTIGVNIESVVLEGTANLTAVGTNEVNALVGNSGNNTLDGRGGDDTMIGGSGNDIYFIDSTSDVVTENAGEGNDIVYAPIDYTIGPNIESVVLIDGAGNINAAGSNVGNALSGQSA